MTSRVDTEIEAPRQPGRDDDQELLDVRKEYLGGTCASRQRPGRRGDDQRHDECLESDPEFATELGELLDRPRS